MQNGNGIQKIDERIDIFPEEDILLRTRCHAAVVVVPIVTTLVFFILLLVFSYFILQFTANIPLFIATILLVLGLIINLIAKQIIDWHCHFYVLTTRRILEVDYQPMFNRRINNVIINQVKSTEIDVETKGVVNHLINMGDVIVTFDRPTRQEEFCFDNVKNPKSVAFLLADVLDVARPEAKFTPLWFKPKNKERPFRTTEEIFSPQSFSTA